MYKSYLDRKSKRRHSRMSDNTSSDQTDDALRYHGYSFMFPYSLTTRSLTSRFSHGSMYMDARRERVKPNVYQDRNRAPAHGRKSCSNHVVLVAVVVVLLLLLLGLGLGLSLGFGLSGSSGQDSTTEYTLTYVAKEDMDTDLLNQSSVAYEVLSATVINALIPICECDPTNVTFFNGSMVIIVYLDVSESLSRNKLLERIHEATEEGSLLPGYTVIDSTISLQPSRYGIANYRIPSDVTSEEHVDQPSTIVSETTTNAAPNPATTGVQVFPYEQSTPPVNGISTPVVTMPAQHDDTTHMPDDAGMIVTSYSVMEETSTREEDLTTPSNAILYVQPRPITHFTGEWGEWSTWSECTVSCGGGTHSRGRLCDQERLCLGVDFQETYCNQRPCPRNIGVWRSWAAWGTCSEECGGGARTRMRTCVQDDDTTCAGDASQTEQCNTHDCPDCSRHCDQGTLVDCVYCACALQVIVGRVMAEGSSLPLATVTISPLGYPDIVFDRTNGSGSFTLNDVCGDTRLMYHTEGYLDQTVRAGDIDGVVRLTQIVALELFMNPVGKSAVVGENVTLCCAVRGSPPPKYYEWFKDGEVIYTESTSTVSRLCLENVTSTDSGVYKCRASNDVSARYSVPATLSVKGSLEDFCLSTPLQHYEQLPENCSYHGENRIEVGRCHNSQCRGAESDQAACANEESYCCGPTEGFQIEVNCTYTYPIYNIVTRCGCQQCRMSRTYIRGTVLKRGLDEPVSEAQILFQNEMIDLTDADGRFNFTTAEILERITITVRVPRSADVVGTTQSINLGPNVGGAHYIWFRLLRKPEPIEFNAGDGVLTSLVSHDGMTLGDISIPPDALYDEHGQIYTGHVVMSVTAIQPHDVESSDAAPGDFSAVDQEGDTQLLTSYGMFGIDFTDDYGNPLQTPADITIDVPTKIVGSETDIDGNSIVKLWTMNTGTGRWEYTSDLIPRDTNGLTRQRRQGAVFSATIRGINTEYTWFNFDLIVRMVCFSKIRVFESDGITPVTDARVSVIQQNGVRGNSVSLLRATTDYQLPGNGYCVAHPCTNDFRDSSTSLTEGVILVDKNDGFHTAAAPRTLDRLNWQPLATSLNYVTEPDAIFVQLHLKTSEERGPFYDWDSPALPFYSERCTYADSTEYSFEFRASSIDCELVNPDPLTNLEGNSNICDPARYSRLHNYAKVIAEKVESCYIKVFAPGFEDYLYFNAVSRVGCAANEYISPGRLYGSTLNCLRGGYTCLEVKTPDGASCSENDIIDDSFTHVTINPIIQSIPLKAVNNIFDDLDINVFDDDKKLSFAMTYRMVTESKTASTGIFCETAESIDIARAAAKHKCLSSAPAEWAVHFEGIWGDWGAWSDCSVSCGLGIKTRSRTCAEEPCLGASTGATDCYEHPCPGDWGFWTHWEVGGCYSCSDTARRTRYCSTDYCLDDTRTETETASCDHVTCPTSWGGWREWSRCSDDVKQTRKRACAWHGYPLCLNGSHEERDCLEDSSVAANDCLSSCGVTFYNTVNAYSYYMNYDYRYYDYAGYIDYYYDNIADCPDYCGSYRDGDCVYYYSQLSCNELFTTSSPTV